MAEDTEYIKLPLQQRVVHKLWKARVHGYTEAIKLFQEESDEKAAIFTTYLPLISKFVSDANAAAQEKGLEATLNFIQYSAVGGKTAKDVMSAIIAKCIGAPKKATQDLSIQIALMYVEIEKQEVVIEEILKGLEHKNPKIVAGCLTILTMALNEFGPQVIAIKSILKPSLALAEDRDKTVRDKTKALIVEIYRWIGDSIKSQLTKLPQVQLTDLDAEFSKLKGEKAAPTRFLRSQQAKQAKEVGQAAGDDADGSSAYVAEIEIDPLSAIEAINVLEKIPNGFYEKIEAKKWLERKEILEELDKVLDYPKFEKADCGDLVRALMKIISKDSNVVVVGVATKCVARLAGGLKKNFHPYASATLPQLLAKFKEKKTNVVTPLREAVDAVYVSTNLENIQEDVIASLDNKNPQIKAETAAFLGRCFAQCTPTILNKKLLKTLATALLKTLNEPDPTVRDCSAEALGVAMKVVGEKVIMPFLPDIDPLKLAKIKECCEKAEVKVAVRVAPKPEPPKAESKKVLSGGAMKAQAPKIQRPVVVEKTVALADEEVDEKAAELNMPADVLKNLGDITWQTRLDSIEVFQNVLMSTDPSDVAAEVMTRVLLKKPGLKENNFQVMKLKLDCLKYLAEKFPLSKLIVEGLIPDVTEKLGDPKNGTLAGETLMSLAEVTNLDIVATGVFEYVFTQRSVKIQQEALDWANEAIQNFGMIVKSQTVIDTLKKGLNSTNMGVRQSAAGLAGVVFLYMGQKLMQRLDEKPGAIALVQSEIDKQEGEQAREASRTCKIPTEPEREPAAPPKVTRPRTATQPKQQEVSDDFDEDSDKVEDKKPVGRVDISQKITEQLLTELSDKNWKVREEALKSLQSMVTDVKIKSNLGELPPLLVQRFVDTNSKLVVTALEVCTAMAVAMGPGSKNHVRTFARGIFNTLGDNKQWVRSAAMTCLNTWTTEAGAKEFFSGEIIPELLKTATPQLKIEVWTWLTDVLNNVKGLPKDELCLIIPQLFSALEDRNAEVRKVGNGAVFGMMCQVGYANMAKEVEKLKPASRPSILQTLDKIRPEVPVSEPKSAVKAKPEVRGKAPAPKSAPKSRASIAPAARPVARKKDEEVDTSPLLLVNKLKNQRAMDEQKLKVARWNFTSPRPEMVEILRDQMSVAGVNKNLIANMFHQDFKFHLKAIESLSDDLANEDAMMANLDLILKWMTLRFFDTNPSVLLKGLEYLQSAFSVLIDRGYQVVDVEANSFIPYLVMKIGDPKDAVRDRVHAILRQFTPMYSPSKLFTHLMEGLKSKNSRLRAECLEELGLLIEVQGTHVCSPSNLKEISKQISDRDNSVRSAALNAIVKAYFHDGEKILKQIGQLSDKDMSYLEERIKRTQQNRTKLMDVTKIVPPEPKCKPEPVVEEEEPEMEPESSPDPEPEIDDYVPEPKTLAPAYRYQPYRQVETPRTPKLQLIEIDDSFLDAPVYVPESIQAKLLAPPEETGPMFDVLKRLSGENIEDAILGGKEMHLVFQECGNKLIPFAKPILDALVAQLVLVNTYDLNTYQTKLGSLYKFLFRIIGDIFEKKTDVSMEADANQLKIIIRELLIALSEDKTITFQEQGYNGWIVTYVSRIIENSNTTNVTCAIINLLFDIVAQPPTNPRVTDMSTKCLLKAIVLLRKSNDLQTTVDLDRVLYTCHVFLQAYPRHTWKDRPSDLPLKAIKTLLMNLVQIQGESILTHMRTIEDPVASELTGYLKKMLKQQPKSAKLTKPMTDKLAEIFKKIAQDGNSEAHFNGGLIELYEFKKQHPDVDLSPIFAPTTPFFKNFVADGLAAIERERGPLKKPVEVHAVVSPKDTVTPEKPPEDPRLLPQYFLDKLRGYQQRLGMNVSSLPDFPPVSPVKDEE